MNLPASEIRPGDHRVSVVIPCYNHGKFLGEAIGSVRAQEYPDLDIIVVNDGSTDLQTLSVFDALDKDVVLIEQSNKGLAAARNRGIQEAAGEFILPLDADDRIGPGFIQQAVAAMAKDHEVGIVYGQTELFGSKTGPWRKPDYAMPEMLFENMIVASALYRKSDWESVGGYRPAMTHAWEDWDFWLALINLGRKVVRLKDVTFYYRISEESMTSRLSFNNKLAMMLQLVLRHKSLYLKNWRYVLSRIFNPARRKIDDPRS